MPKQIRIELSDDLHRAVRVRSLNTGVTLAEAIEAALWAWLREPKRVK